MMRQGMAPVLVVEYDEGVRTVLHDLLTNVGYAVIEHATDCGGLGLPRRVSRGRGRGVWQPGC